MKRAPLTTGEILLIKRELTRDFRGTDAQERGAVWIGIFALLALAAMIAAAIYISDGPTVPQGYFERVSMHGF